MWVAEHARRRALLRDATAVQHDHAMREEVDDGEIVRDEEGGESEPLLQFTEELEHPRLHRDIERTGRLVGDQQLRVEGERPGERRALTLTSGQLVRVTVAERLRQLHGLEQLVDFVAGGRRVARVPVHDERFGDALRDRQERIEARCRILEDEPEILPALSEVALAHSVHLGAEHAQ